MSEDVNINFFLKFDNIYFWKISINKFKECSGMEQKALLWLKFFYNKSNNQINNDTDVQNIHNYIPNGLPTQCNIITHNCNTDWKGIWNWTTTENSPVAFVTSSAARLATFAASTFKRYAFIEKQKNMFQLITWIGISNSAYAIRSNWTHCNQPIKFCF